MKRNKLCLAANFQSLIDRIDGCKKTNTNAKSRKWKRGQTPNNKNKSVRLNILPHEPEFDSETFAALNRLDGQGTLIPVSTWKAAAVHWNGNLKRFSPMKEMNKENLTIELRSYGLCIGWIDGQYTKTVGGC